MYDLISPFAIVVTTHLLASYYTYVNFWNCLLKNKTEWRTYWKRPKPASIGRRHQNRSDLQFWQQQQRQWQQIHKHRSHFDHHSQPQTPPSFPFSPLTPQPNTDHKPHQTPSLRTPSSSPLPPCTTCSAPVSTRTASLSSECRQCTYSGDRIPPTRQRAAGRRALCSYPIAAVKEIRVCWRYRCGGLRPKPWQRRWGRCDSSGWYRWRPIGLVCRHRCLCIRLLARTGMLWSSICSCLFDANNNQLNFHLHFGKHLVFIVRSDFRGWTDYLLNLKIYKSSVGYGLLTGFFDLVGLGLKKTLNSRLIQLNVSISN